MEIPGYEIKGVIGKGGMARVYLALHKALNRKVAIKVMNRQEGADSDFSDRFLREARIVANLTHPNIVTIHDVGEHDGHNYLVMELLPSGETLSDKIKAGVDRQYALSIVRQVATALKAAHEKNIVHRDIKPDNIMFRADGSVVLMDFGIARSVDSAATQMTQAGLIIGTPQYISPEQAQGKNIGPCSDIYSLGIVFYEMLMGKVPYTADTPIALVLKHISEPVPDLTGDAALYQPVLDRMMAKSREQRYSNCDQIIADIDRIAAGKPATQVTQVLSPAAVNKARAAAESLTIVEKIESTGAEKNAAQATEISSTTAGTGAGTAEIQKTEILSTASSGAGSAEAQKTEIFNTAAFHKDKAKVVTLARKKKTHPVGRSKKSGTKSKSFLWITLGLLIAISVYMFVDVDMGKLKMLVGLDPGPVYSRVGRLITIPEGSFNMGNGSGDSTENPVHTVSINGFRLGETEVTQKQWQLVTGTTPSHFSGCDDCPIDSVSWNDVQEFFKKLNTQTGLRFRLPSEAEWEYACRSAGKNEKYCGGDDESTLAWYGNNSDEKTHSVQQKQANGLGLYDMSGNVWEWTQDCWHDSYDGAPSNGQAWEKGTCAQRVLRGGSWIGVAGGLSSTGRFASPPAKSSRNFGFRVAQDL
jgi:serine/threonine protein kinase